MNKKLWFSFFLFETDFKDEATFTISRMGHFKLAHDGFTYLKLRKVNDSTRWRCSRYHYSKCRGKAITQKINSVEMVKAYGTHNHGQERET